jgi:hypothetical protein
LLLNKNPSRPNQNAPPPPDIMGTFRPPELGCDGEERIKYKAPVDGFIVIDDNTLNVVVKVNVLEL